MRILAKLWQEKEIIVILIFTSLLLTQNVNKPFIGHHDWNGAYWGSVARNYLSNINSTIPIFTWKTVDHVYIGHWEFNSHYTPLLPTLFSISFVIFGFHESSLRLVTIFFSLLLFLAINGIGRQLFNKNIGLLAAAITTVTPMFQYFGKLPDHEPIVTSLIAIAFYFYIKVINKKSSNHWLFLIALILALMESWSAYFFLIVLVVHQLLFYHSKHIALKISLLSGVFVIALQAVLIYIAKGPQEFSNIFSYGLERMNSSSSASIIKFTPLQFVITETRYMFIYFTRIVIILAVIWLIYFIVKLIRKRLASNDLLLVLLFVYGAGFILVFRNLAFIHDYKLYVLLPFFSLASAHMLQIFWGKRNNWPIKIIHAEIWKIAQYTTVLILISIIFFERYPFVKTLQASSLDKPGLELGTFLAQQTQPQDIILINSTEYYSFYWVFVNYYGNRHLETQDLTLKAFLTKPASQFSDYIVLIKNRPTDEKLRQYLLKNYQFQENGLYTLVDLRKKISG